MLDNLLILYFNVNLEFIYKNGGIPIDRRISNKRQNFRANLNVDGEYSLNGSQGKCTIIDISNTGIGLKVPQFLTEGDILDIYFEIPDYGKVNCKVNVVFMKGTKVGANFTSIDERSKSIINSYIDKFASTNLRKFFR